MLIPLALAPILLLFAAAFAFLRPGLRPAGVAKAAEWAALGALAGAAGAAIALAIGGPDGGTGHLLGPRLDILSVAMALLVGFIGWIVLRFTAAYLDGDPRQGAFTGWMAFTLAAVMLVVQAGHLAQLAIAWLAVGVGLRRLLLHYADRPQAKRAARKMGLCAGAADIALIAAIALLLTSYGTGDIGAILDAARAGEGGALAIVAGFLLALSAVLKSAQFPTHGWLTEVMETPTPVSALLHAGVINAGGFLLIRFADLMLLAPGALALLALIGGFTALFGGLVMLTQPAVKTSLAWSTVAQMGFMILQCGLALFPLALLHILAHSLYKAHAFLAAGGAVAQIAANRRPGPVAVPRGWAVGKAFLLAIAIYALVGFGFGFGGMSAQAMALGAILIFGVAYLFAQGLADAAPAALTRRLTLYAGATAVGYFALHAGVTALTATLLPAPPAPGPLEWALIALAVISFGLIAVAQSTFALWSRHPATEGLRTHLANGLYANALLDRLTGGWRIAKP